MKKRKRKVKRHGAGAAKNVLTPRATAEPERDQRSHGVILPDGRVLVGALQTVDAAKYMGISLPTFRRLRKRGLIRGNRMLRHWLYPIKELDACLERGLVE
jgi:excisionase family DNA binding protein